MTDPVPMPPPRSLRIASEMGIDPSDPAFVILKAVDIMIRQGQHELSTLVTKLADDVAANSALAEQAARAKAEKIITEAVEWEAGQMRAAGRDAAQTVLNVVQAHKIVTDAPERSLFTSLLAAFLCGIAVGSLLIYCIY